MRVWKFTLFLLAISTGVFASNNQQTIKLRMQGPTGRFDDLTIYFDQGVGPTYNFQEDAQKVFSNVPGVPAFFSLTSDNYECSTNGFGTLTTNQTVSLGYRIDTTGSYKISAVILNNFDPTSIITLEDKLNGNKIDLRQNFATVLLSDTDAETGRFAVHVSYAASYASVNAGCNNNDGQISVALDPQVTWPLLQLFDANNNLIATDSNVIGNASFTNLPSGDYHTVFTTGSYTATNSYHLNGNYVTASIGLTVAQIYTYQDVVYDAITTNANQYSWDFGDGTLIGGVAHPDQVYLVPGTYTINLSCRNDYGCTANASIQVVVLEGQAPSGIEDINKKDVTVSAVAKTVTLNMNDNGYDHSTLKVFNLLGQPVYSAPLTEQVTTINLDEQPTGYYLVSVNNSGKLTTKRIFITK